MMKLESISIGGVYLIEQIVKKSPLDKAKN